MKYISSSGVSGVFIGFWTMLEKEKDLKTRLGVGHGVLHMEHAVFLHYTELDHSVNIKVVDNRIIFPTPLTLHQLDFGAMSYAQNTKQ